MYLARKLDAYLDAWKENKDRKPAFWLLVFAVLASATAAVCFLTNPLSDRQNNIDHLNLNTGIHNSVAGSEGEGESYHPLGTLRQDLRETEQVYQVTPEDQINETSEKGEFVIYHLHYKTADGWYSEGHHYQYRLEITGRLSGAEKNTTFIVLSNTKDITFEQTWKASGLSSNLEDYFDPEEAIIAGIKIF